MIRIITLSQIWDNILIFFGIKNQTTTGHSNAIEFNAEYNNKSGVNLTYIASNKIANIVTTDSQVNVRHSSQKDSNRADHLQQCALQLWKHKKRIVSRAAGVGKVLLVPYVANDKIEYDIITQDRVVILNTDNDRVTDLAILANSVTSKNTKYGKFKRYTLESDKHTISEFYANLTTGAVLGDSPPACSNWKTLPPISINNVDRMLFGEVDCPVDPRNNDKFYCAKITDGCDSIIADIQRQFDYLANEYELKKSFIGADSQLFSKDPVTGKYSLPDSQLFKIIESGTNDFFFEVFDPDIRAEPIYLRLKNTFELLENHIGLSRGIYTSPENIGAYNNQSNIKRSVFDTYALVTEFRDNLKYGITDYLYACNVLSEYFGIVPSRVAFREINIEISWSNAMIEDSSEEFGQLAELQSRGGVKLSRLNSWVTGQSLDEAQAEIDEVQKKEPSLKQLVGVE